MNKTQKETFVSDFRDKLGKAPVVYLTDFTGLDVKSMTKLRDELRAHFTEEEISTLTAIVGMINLWNRVQISSH